VSAGQYLELPASYVARRRRVDEQNALARARYETKHPGRSHHDKVAEKRQRDAAWLAKPFIMWDGEGPQDTGYSLFGNSLGDELCNPNLNTEDCLKLILATASRVDGIHFWFGGNYDVSMILRELPHRHLRILANVTRTVWRGYQIEHIPHKWLKIRYGSLYCKIYDVRSFFQGDYNSALADFEIGTKAERDAIASGKRDRPIFLWAEIEEIKVYWKLELKLGPLLMEELRQRFYSAGYIPRSWHGPGALARMALKRHGVYKAKALCPPKVQEAARYAFAGGRFELFQAGHIQGKVYNADINSAYPYFATFLPNLNHGTWRRTRTFETGKFAVWHIRYDAAPNNTRAFPLFRRLANGCVVWPSRVEGWYWQPEAELVADDPDAKFIEGWVFDEDDETDRPFKFLAEYYAIRQEWKSEPYNAAELTLKLIINAIYGQLAQRAGWDRVHNMAPRTHQLEWAGFITSGCRAAIYRACSLLGDKLISIDTDGIYSTTPIDGVHTGKALGEWEVSEYDDGIFWQSGIYCLKRPTDKIGPSCDGWRKAKSRGIKKGSYIAEELLRCVYEGDTLKLSKHMFITYGLAEIHGWNLHNTWIDVPHEMGMGGGKRIHFPKACDTYCRAPVHRLLQWEPVYGVSPTGDMWSHPHKLPWLGDNDDEDEYDLRATELHSVNHLDSDDEWMLDFA
jgi:DNA polymerase type B, organellar and viral